MFKNTDLVFYSYWGFLGDYKFGKEKTLLSTPDGNAFYSTSIIKGFIDKGYDVAQVMPDRDKYGYEAMGDFLFSSFGKNMRSKAYNDIEKNDVEYMGSIVLYFDQLESYWKSCVEKHVNSYAIVEWRFMIEGRNSPDSFKDGEYGFQPDYVIQESFLKFCAREGIKVFIFDLDYKLNEDDVDWFNSIGLDFVVIELGFKWYSNKVRSLHVEIPFDFSLMKESNSRLAFSKKEDKMVCYVGNRYERDDVAAKYLRRISDVDVYGKWLNADFDFPNFVFHGRANVPQVKSAYEEHMVTVLLAKDEYYKYGFMTARILESVFYGCVPLFAEEYGARTIGMYAGACCEELTVSNYEDVKDRIGSFYANRGNVADILDYLKKRLKFMDVSIFVESLEREM